MYGFGINNLNNSSTQLSGNYDSDIIEAFSYGDFCMTRTTRNKFVNDKLFFENEKYIVILEGIILNKSDLCIEYGHRAWDATIIEMIEQGEDCYFDLFRGNFCGAHYSKESKKWVVYTNFNEDKPVYYYCKSNVFVVSSDLKYIFDVLKKENIDITIDENGIYELLSFGFMINGRTYANEIKKIPYGSYLEYNNKELNINRYYDFNYCKGTEVDIDATIDKLDLLFREAVKLEFEKDREYGYKHVACLSGGLDSRMTVWVAYDLGYEQMLNINFGHSDYLDERIAKMVSQRLGTELMHKSLNDGLFLADIDGSIKLNCGMSSYSGICHFKSIVNYLNFMEFGMIHSGEVGDAIVGVFDKKGSDLTQFPGAFSDKLTDRIDRDWDVKMEDSVEKFMMKTRAWSGVVQSIVAIDSYCESISPFMYRDFFEYCISEIPHVFRSNHYIYCEWIKRKYPDAAKIPLERYKGGLITDGKFKKNIYKMKSMGLKKTLNWVLWKTGIIHELDRTISGASMNPFDLYYERREVKEYLEEYYKNNIKAVKEKSLFTQRLIDDMEWLWNTGTTREKTQVLTVIGGAKLLIID